MSAATKENIKRLLDLTGVTHETLAKIAGVNRSAVSQWKSGKTEPRMGHAQRIADHYGLRVENIINPNGMKYVHRGVDGKLHDDNATRVSDITRDALALSPSSEMDDVHRVYSVVSMATSSYRALNATQSELLDMFDSLNESGKQMAINTIAAFVNMDIYRK